MAQRSRAPAALSSRGPKFNPQQPQGDSQPSIWDMVPFSNTQVYVKAEHYT